MATETGGGPRTPTGRRRRCSARPQQRARRPQQKPGRGSCGGAGRTAAGRQTTEHAPRQQRAAGGPRGVPQAAWRAAAAGEAMTAELYSPPGCGGHPPPPTPHTPARRGAAGRGDACGVGHSGTHLPLGAPPPRASVVARRGAVVACAVTGALMSGRMSSSWLRPRCGASRARFHVHAMVASYSHFPGL